MIDTQTVLILGAGASKEAGGFPGGQELLHNICVGLADGPNLLNLRLRDLGYKPVEIDAFRKQLIQSNCASVDAFLQRRDDLLDIGKSAIAVELLKCEQKSEMTEGKLCATEGKLFATDPDKYHWYKYLLEKLDSDGFDRFTDNKLTIVTFNYDRSLEHFLFRSLMSRHNKHGTPSECAQMISTIPIVHVYGSLGELDWKSNGNDDAIEYGATPNMERIRHCIGSIRIIGEGDATAAGDPAFKMAREYIGAARKVVFLGFGYHKANVSRLQLDTVLKKTPVVEGTSFGMTSLQRSKLESTLFPGRGVGNMVLCDSESTRQRREKKKGDCTCLDWFNNIRGLD